MEGSGPREEIVLFKSNNSHVPLDEGHDNRHTGNKAASARKWGLCVRLGETTDILLNAKKVT